MPNDPSSARIRSSRFGPNRWRSSRPFCSCWQVKGNVHVAVYFIARFITMAGPAFSAPSASFRRPADETFYGPNYFQKSTEPTQ